MYIKELILPCKESLEFVDFISLSLKKYHRYNTNMITDRTFWAAFKLGVFFSFS